MSLLPKTGFDHLEQENFTLQVSKKKALLAEKTTDRHYSIKIGCHIVDVSLYYLYFSSFKKMVKYCFTFM